MKKIVLTVQDKETGQMKTVTITCRSHVNVSTVAREHVKINPHERVVKATVKR